MDMRMEMLELSCRVESCDHSWFSGKLGCNAPTIGLERTFSLRYAPILNIMQPPETFSATRNTMDTSPRSLIGRNTVLTPLGTEHLDRLCETGLDSELWRWVPTKVATREQMQKYIESALNDQAQGLALPFVIVDARSGQIAGTTRLGSVNRRDRNAEIGWTWIAKPWQRTSLNTEAKLLLLTLAFETWDCVRIEFTTHAGNEQSRSALLRIGATLEGILRKNRILSDGEIRNTAVYSITDDEWPAVKQNLLKKLAG